MEENPQSQQQTQAAPVAKAEPDYGQVYVPERVASGVPGFDELTCGGLERNSIVLIGGDTGTGKTTFCLQFLYRGITDYGENGLFISFSEPREEILRTASMFGWNLGDLEKQDRLLIMRYQPKDVMEIVAEGGGTIRDTIEAFNIKRVCVDSITAFALMFDTTYKEQQNLLDLFNLLHDLNCTTLVVSEEPANIDNPKTNRAEFVSDGIVHFYNVHQKGVRVRAAEVIKMRHSAIREVVCPMRIDEHGITMQPNQQITDI